VSELANHFRDRVRDGLDADRQELLHDVAGAGSDSSELRRGLLLADRAVRDWAALAASHGHGARGNAYERLDSLIAESGRAVQTAAIQEQKTGLDAQRELVAEMVWGIGERLTGIDEVEPLSRHQAGLNRIAEEAAEILLATGRILEDPDWVLAAANDALAELTALA
jgi:uncharacterized membrane protein YccC